MLSTHMLVFIIKRNNMAKKPVKPVKKPVKKGKSKLPPAVVKYLDEAGISHEILEHKTVYTAIDAAMTLKKKMDEIAKSLLVMADKDYYLILLPADKNVDMEKLKKLIAKSTKKDIKTIKIPGEKVMEDLLKLKAGTVSAFGKVHKLPVFMEKSFEKVKKAVFPSGSFNHSVEMMVKDFVKLENAVLGTFGVKKKVKLQPVKQTKKVPKIKQKK